MTSIYHITTAHQAAEAERVGTYLPAEFTREGFIHCSYRHQVLPVANRIFVGKENLVLLKVDPSRLTVRIVDENLEGGTELFPHVYGAIPWSAVVEVIDFHPDQDGLFRKPLVEKSP